MITFSIIKKAIYANSKIIGNAKGLMHNSPFCLREKEMPFSVFKLLHSCGALLNKIIQILHDETLNKISICD